MSVSEIYHDIRSLFEKRSETIVPYDDKVHFEEDLINVNSGSLLDPELAKCPSLEYDFLQNSDPLMQNSGHTGSYCIGTVDIINSTKISARMNIKQISQYYEIFLNSMSAVVRKFDGIVIKNVGDCLMYYFPESSQTRQSAARRCVECSLAMMSIHDELSLKISKLGLPNLDYRVSNDYGPVVIMTQNGSSTLDLFGPAVNMCCKINRLAAKNGCVMGGDFYELVKSYPEYPIKEVNSYSIGLKQTYPVYSLLFS